MSCACTTCHIIVEDGFNNLEDATDDEDQEEEEEEEEDDSSQELKGTVKFSLGSFSKDLECLPKEPEEFVASECKIEVKAKALKDGLTQIQGILSIDGKSEEEMQALNNEITLYYYDQSQEVQEKDEDEEEEDNEEEVGSDQALAGQDEEERTEEAPANGKRKELDEKFNKKQLIEKSLSSAREQVVMSQKIIY